MISNHGLVGVSAQSERREGFAATIDQVLRLGWFGEFREFRGGVVRSCGVGPAGELSARRQCQASVAAPFAGRSAGSSLDLGASCTRKQQSTRTP